MKMLWLILPAVLVGVILAPSPAPAGQPKPDPKKVGPHDEPPLASVAVKKTLDPRPQKKKVVRIRLFVPDEDLARIRWVGSLPIPYPPIPGPDPPPVTRMITTFRK
jgi:hypothetical protein